MSRDNKSTPESNWISREDLQDIAKIGGDLLKRTVTSSIDVIKDVTDTLPKDASQLISKSREEVMKGLSKEFAQNLVSLAVERVFSAVRDHRLDISIRVRKAGESASDSSTTAADDETHSSHQSAHERGRGHRHHHRSAHNDERSHQERHGPESHSHPKRNPQARHRP